MILLVNFQLNFSVEHSVIAASQFYLCLTASPSMRGATPLDVAAASVMDNNELALALTESDLQKVILRFQKLTEAIWCLSYILSLHIPPITGLITLISVHLLNPFSVCTVLYLGHPVSCQLWTEKLPNAVG